MSESSAAAAQDIRRAERVAARLIGICLGIIDRVEKLGMAPPELPALVHELGEWMDAYKRVDPEVGELLTAQSTSGAIGQLVRENALAES